MENNIINRRNFFKLSLAASSAVALGGLGSPLFGVDSTHTHSAGVDSASTDTKSQKLIRGRMFFQRQTEFDTLSAACERIYPKDEVCGGAIDLGVPYFIDNQLASAYGFNAREYMQGPFIEGKPEYGYQSPLYRRDIFLIGIQGLQDRAQDKYKVDFAMLEPKQQDSILKDCESGKLTIEGINAKDFFKLLRDMTIAGVLADPIYQGNLNMEGWKAMEYPGAQMSYIDTIASDEYSKIDPLGLSDM